MHILRPQWRDGFEPPSFDVRLAELVEELAFSLGGAATDGEGDPEPPAGVAVRRLPSRNRDFVGREDLFAELEAALGDGSGTVGIVGGPGFGKSQLALEYAHRHAGEYELVFFVSAEGRDAAVSNFAALAEDLGLPPQETQEKAVVAVRERFADAERWLLIFDNAEHPIHLRDLIPGGNGNVVVTSVERSGWGGMGARLVSVVPLSAEEATRFLLRRIGRDDAAGAALVAEEFDGNPLLLEQAAAYIGDADMSFAEYLELLHEDFDTTLAEGMPNDYSRTAPAAWNLVLAKVVETSPEAGDLFSLSAFLAPDDIAIRELGLALRSVNVLVRYSLVHRTGEDAFSLHRTVQTMARARLTGEERTSWAETAVELCLSALPVDPSDVLDRPLCARLLPHATAALAHAEELGAEAYERARLHDRVGVFHASRARYADARTELESALSLLAAEGREDEPLAGTVRNHLGGVLRDLGDFGDAQAQHEDALRLHEKTLGADHPEVGDDLVQFGLTLAARGDPAGAREQLQRALSIHLKALGEEHRSIAEDHLSLAWVLLMSGNIPPAIARLESAIAVYEALGKNEHPLARAARYVVDLLAAAASGAELCSARERLGGLIEIYEQAYDEDHPEVAALRQLLADDLLKVSDLDGAIENYEKAHEIDRAAFGESHWTVARDLMRLFAAFAARGDLQAARDRLARSLAIFAGIAGAEDRGLPLYLSSFDDALGSLSGIPGATGEFERIVGVCGDETGEESILAAAALDHLGAELDEAGASDLALAELRRAADLLERHLGPQHVRLAKCLSRLGHVLSRRGELEAAERVYERACSIHELAEYRNDLDLMNDLLGVLPVRMQLDEQAEEQDSFAEARAPDVLRRIRALADRAIGVEPLRSLGKGLREAGMVDEALAMEEQVLRSLEATYGLEHPEVAATLRNVGLVHVERRDLDAARSAFQRVLEIHVHEYGPDHLEVATDLISYLAPALAGLGERDRAVRELERGLAIYERLPMRKPLEQMRADAWLMLFDHALAYGHTTMPGCTSRTVSTSHGSRGARRSSRRGWERCPRRTGTKTGPSFTSGRVPRSSSRAAHGTRGAECAPRRSQSGRTTTGCWTTCYDNLRRS